MVLPNLLRVRLRHSVIVACRDTSSARQCKIKWRAPTPKDEIDILRQLVHQLGGRGLIVAVETDGLSS